MTFNAVSFLERLVSGDPARVDAEPCRTPTDDAKPAAVGGDGAADLSDLAGPLTGSGLVESESGYLVPADLPEPWRELYEERAAIREYDGGQAREHAEAAALSEILEGMRRGA
ncbi:MAG: hypothetical protein IT449_04845 [Phycisphaerales bacterium]|nr:hypothetical protein [Phycisphaerales bacterium]